MRDDEADENSRRASRSLSEFDFIERIRRRALDNASHFPGHSSLALGIGDDAAVIRQRDGRDTVISSDLLIEEIDFRLETITPWLLGFKALAVSLSDIAAMGARPRHALLSLGVPRAIWNSGFVDAFYDGFFSLARKYRVELIGGDVSRTPERVVIDSVVLGEAPRGHAIRRRGARPGDHIFVTGALGGAAAGLHLLEGGARIRRQWPRTGLDRTIEHLLFRQLRPEPRAEWGARLGQERLAAAMIDISDGLSSDLAHLCRSSDVGAALDARRIPVDPAILSLRGLRVPDPLRLALHGGEDFELVFTVSPRDLRRLPREVCGVPATYIGDVTNRAGRIEVWDGSRAWNLEPGGFMHFWDNP